MSLIACEQHGPSPYCIICRHLREETGLGYFAIPAEPKGPAQAWCEECDHILDQERGWTDKADAQAEWKLYCTQCYEERLRLHRLISWVDGTSPDE